MIYCTKQNFEDRFGDKELIRLTDRSHQGVFDDQVFTQAATDASAEVDGYLRGRYKLPLSSVPVVLVRVACDMTRYYLHSGIAPEEVTERYKAAIRFLKDVASGQVTLGADANQALPPQSAGAEVTAGTGGVFDRSEGGIV